MKQFGFTIPQQGAPPSPVIISRHPRENAMNYKLLSETALAFIDHESFDAQLTCALKKLCTSLQLSRVYVFLDGKERATMGAIHEWCAEGVTRQWMQDVPYETYASWKNLLVAERKILASDIAWLPEDVQRMLDTHGVKSLFAYPIEFNREIAGFVGFDDTVRQRLWDAEEVALMTAAARMISAFYERDVLRQQLPGGVPSRIANAADESIHDPLTGLHNKRYVFERLKGFDAEYARLGRNFCVSIIDLDNFKNVNYSYGSDAGDFILQEFGKLLNETIRPYDVCGRFGGEEFIVVSVNASATETVFMIERLMNTMRSRVFVFNGMEIRIRFSCGIASVSEFTPENMSVDTLVETANRRMYAAKQSGRDRFVIPSPTV
ncbi:MAG: sensor domain-containing diguanylate cyclase [Oxalobacter sp.]|nr:MAG: sensor domain-containing diguanylate cyclase [Oxalobacter sp.]